MTFLLEKESKTFQILQEKKASFLSKFSLCASFLSKFKVCPILIHATMHLAKNSSQTTSQKSMEKFYILVISNKEPAEFLHRHHCRHRKEAVFISPA